MTPIRTARITMLDGMAGSFDESLLAEAEDQILVTLDDGRDVRVPRDALVPESDGQYRLRGDLSETTRTADEEIEEMIVPVIAEELDVQKRRVETGRVRIAKRVQERQEVIDEALLHEEVEVERVPLNRVVDGPLPVRYEGETVIVPLVEEVLVVEKRLLLKEEIRVTRRQVVENERHSVTLRSEEARIERLEPNG